MAGGGELRGAGEGAVLGLVWLCAASWASAEPPRAHLTLSRPAESFCPTADALERDVEALAGRSVFTDASEADVEIECVLHDAADGVHARIELRESSGAALGQRELHAAPGACASLRQPLSVVLLMWLDREQPLDPPASNAPPPSADRQPLGFGISAGALSGVLPRVSTGFGVMAAVDTGPRVGVRLAVSYWLPTRVQTPRGSGAVMHAFTLDGRLCPRLLRDHQAVVLSLCGGAQLAGVLASPRGLTVDTRKLGVFGQGLVTLELLRRWRSAHLAAELGPGVTFTRPRFLLVQADGSERVVHRPSRLTAVFRLSLVIPTH